MILIPGVEAFDDEAGGVVTDGDTAASNLALLVKLIVAEAGGLVAKEVVLEGTEDTSAELGKGEARGETSTLLVAVTGRLNAAFKATLGAKGGVKELFDTSSNDAG